MKHYEARLQDRPYTSVLTRAQLDGLCYECDTDTAVILVKDDTQHGQTCGAYRSRSESNGEYIVLIIRNHEPKTIMYRRANQPMTCEALRVAKVLDYTQ